MQRPLLVGIADLNGSGEVTGPSNFIWNYFWTYSHFKGFDKMTQQATILEANIGEGEHGHFYALCLYKGKYSYWYLFKGTI